MMQPVEHVPPENLTTKTELPTPEIPSPTSNPQVSAKIPEENPLQRIEAKRPKYAVINDVNRKKLIELIIAKGKSMQEAAQECNINVSTAKGIMQVYLKEGRIGKKRTRDRTTNIITNVIMASNNPFTPSQSILTPLFTTISSQQNSGLAGAAIPPTVSSSQQQGQHQMQSGNNNPPPLIIPQPQRPNPATLITTNYPVQNPLLNGQSTISTSNQQQQGHNNNLGMNALNILRCLPIQAQQGQNSNQNNNQMYQENPNSMLQQFSNLPNAQLAQLAAGLQGLLALRGCSNGQGKQ